MASTLQARRRSRTTCVHGRGTFKAHDSHLKTVRLRIIGVHSGAPGTERKKRWVGGGTERLGALESGDRAMNDIWYLNYCAAEENKAQDKEKVD